MGVQHRGAKSGCKLRTLFGSDCDDVVSAVREAFKNYLTDFFR